MEMRVGCGLGGGSYALVLEGKSRHLYRFTYNGDFNRSESII